MKFALISNVLPPLETAPAAIINRLLRDFDPESYCLLSSKNYTSGEYPYYFSRLRGRFYHIPSLLKLDMGTDVRLRAAVEVGTFGFGVALRARAIARILKSENCEAVVCCTSGDEVQDFPAAYLASRFTGTRFYAYLLDSYMHMASYGIRRTFLRRFEAPIMKGVAAIIENPIMRGAAGVIAHNEFQRDEVRRRYQVDATVIHNPCDLGDYERARASHAEMKEIPLESDEVKIVFTGGVGELHFQAFHNLLKSLKLLNRENLKLHLYTSALSAQDCEREGISGPVVYHPHEVISAMPVIQQQADILFLPLAFDTKYPEIISTAAPGKMGEYLAARRPILVHAPADSFISWYFRRYECGIVVDQNDPVQLANALDSLLADASLRERLSERAWERAKTDFNIATAQVKLAELIGFDVAPLTSSK